MLHNKLFRLNNMDEKCILRSGDYTSYSFNLSDEEIKCKYRLFFSCEDAFLPQVKNEGGGDQLYMLIDDSLDYDNAENSRYCLNFSCEKPIYATKRAVKKIMWQPLIYGLFGYINYSKGNDIWNCGISVKAKDLVVEQDGYLRFRIERWDVRENINPHNTSLEPDEVFEINVPEGTYPYTVLSNQLKIVQEKTACIVVYVEGERYSGEVYFENPFVSDAENRNLLPEFEPGQLGLRKFAWLGQNLSKREWPRFEIAINDRVFFDDEVFLKIHNFSPVEVPVPMGMVREGENKISIKYTSDYHDTIPVVINEVAMLQKEESYFNVVRCPDEVTWGEDVKLLVETSLSEAELLFESEDFVLKRRKIYDEFNLCVLTLGIKEEKNNLAFSLSYKDEAKTYDIKRCIRKTVDNVLSGSGDMVYVNVEKPEDVCDYLKWYVANDIGNFVTVRPVFRWGGQRSVNPKVWSFFTDICDELGLLYVNISDGRDIPGLAANPSLEMLKGGAFLGRQLHERDGQLFYWADLTGHPVEINTELEEFYDVALRIGRENPDTLEGALRSFNLSWGKNGYSFKRMFSENNDIKEAHDLATAELRDLSCDSFIRHTGPSVMFKYFYQSGFEWAGAETMYGSTEIPLAFLRGASLAHGKDKFGVHLALQWSTYPHDTLQRYKRYLLSLYVPYMHGVTDINTEEGLWFMEARYAHFNRLSEVCEEHRKMLRRFNKFIRTHSRTGRFYTPIAFLHGRMDGWCGFSSRKLWGMTSMNAGEESFSWKLLLSFYPLNVIGERGFTKIETVHADNDKPYGLLSGTPKGNPDVVPVENGDFSNYKVLVFAGYNLANAEDFDRILAFVNNGGTLICSWPHFSTTTLRADIENYRLSFLKHDIVNKICISQPEFKTDFVDGKEVKICSNISKPDEIISKTDNESPLVCRYNIGKGAVLLVNTLFYPGNESVLPVYSKLVESVNEELLEKEKCRVFCGEDVEYTVFAQEDGTFHYYFTAVDWYNNSDDLRKAEIQIGEYKYPINLRFGEMVKLVTNGSVAVWPECHDAEVVSVSDNDFTVQGESVQKFFVASQGDVKEYFVEFGNESIKNTVLNK